jgi:hypothetical protein
MGCQLRQRTGDCNHHQCPFQEETEHGYECVDIIIEEGVAFCECGEGCLEKCPHSWIKNSSSKVEKAVMKFIAKNE